MININAKAKKKSKKKIQEVEMTSVPVLDNAKPLTLVGAKFPTFSVVTHKQDMLLSSSLNNTKPKAIVLFNPGCGHCKEVLKKVVEQKSKFEGVDFVFICGLQLLEYIDGFAKEMKCENEKNIFVSCDNSDITKDIFEYKGIPQIMIYNKDQLLQKTFYKEIDIDSLQYYLNK
jgi:thiol-disulfide isomerase/thioredoxin